MFGHEIEKGINGCRTQQAYAVNVSKLRFARLSSRRHSACQGKCQSAMRLTNRRQVPKQTKKRSGPARSASSMMCSSMRCNGFRTVNDFARICEKLIPSSIRFIVHTINDNSIECNEMMYLLAAVVLPRSHPYQRQSTIHLQVGYCHHMLAELLAEQYCLAH